MQQGKLQPHLASLYRDSGAGNKEEDQKHRAEKMTFYLWWWRKHRGAIFIRMCPKSACTHGSVHCNHYYSLRKNCMKSSQSHKLCADLGGTWYKLLQRNKPLLQRLPTVYDYVKQAESDSFFCLFFFYVHMGGKRHEATHCTRSLISRKERLNKRYVDKSSMHITLHYSTDSVCRKKFLSQNL